VMKAAVSGVKRLSELTGETRKQRKGRKDERQQCANGVPYCKPPGRSRDERRSVAEDAAKSDKRARGAKSKGPTYAEAGRRGGGGYRFRGRAHRGVSVEREANGSVSAEEVRTSERAFSGHGVATASEDPRAKPSPESEKPSELAENERGSRD